MTIQPPTISSVTSATQNRRYKALVHTVTWSGVSANSTSFAYTIGGGTATSGTDYGTPTFSNGVTLSAGNLIVPAGVTSFTDHGQSTQDTIDEPNETHNVTVGGVTGVGTINDDDAAPTISRCRALRQLKQVHRTHGDVVKCVECGYMTFACRSFTDGTATGGGTGLHQHFNECSI